MPPLLPFYLAPLPGYSSPPLAHICMNFLLHLAQTSPFPIRLFAMNFCMCVCECVCVGGVASLPSACPPLRCAPAFSIAQNIFDFALTALLLPLSFSPSHSAQGYFSYVSHARTKQQRYAHFALSLFAFPPCSRRHCLWSLPTKCKCKQHTN